MIITVAVQPSEVYNFEGSLTFIRNQRPPLPMIWRDAADQTLHEDPRPMGQFP